MSLFDLQDVCIVIGSLVTLDLPMVVDLIGIYVLKGPYCTLTTTNWFLQALSVIPRGSWGDVARRFTMIRWATSILHTRPPLLSLNLTPPAAALRRPVPPPCACFDPHDEEFPSVLNSSVLLVQADEGVLIPIVDLIRRIYRRLQFKSQISLRILVGARRLDASKVTDLCCSDLIVAAVCGNYSSEAGSSNSASLDFSRWCISAYPAVARDQLLRVSSCWYVSCDDQQRALRD
ncbi:hypothetical protein F511_22228 [Dorcoceras hygrometricum]|uniref:Uncharacterized protein n=1 Tax=Dorcoceras hygrometricum TaxID=472368 RepID=A0A2Z7CNP7_9LAMI|nr:hypothetical protein F511_22228 [Dorcoceras hygrometricum]